MQETDVPLEPVQRTESGRGCFFYGCVTLSVVMLLFFLAVGVVLYSGYRYATGLIKEYTSATPMPLPRVELAPEQMADLDKRWDAFRKGAETGEETPPLVLTADELNAKMAQNPDLKDHLHVEFPGDRIEGQISLPLDSIGLPGLRGRYLNGKGRLRAHLADGALTVVLESLEVNGKPVPDPVMASFRGQNLAADFSRDPHNAEELRKIESLEVKDGKLIIKARKRVHDTAKTKATETPKADEGGPRTQAQDEAKVEAEKAESKSP